MIIAPYVPYLAENAGGYGEHDSARPVVELGTDVRQSSIGQIVHVIAVFRPERLHDSGNTLGLDGILVLRRGRIEGVIPVTVPNRLYALVQLHLLRVPGDIAGLVRYASHGGRISIQEAV